jgi:26S proteasome regulatory subunit (ATPase 3-interacting protein)
MVKAEKADKAADKEKDGKATVLKYLTNQNRPYSANDLVANLRNEIGKTAIQKILDTLTEEGKIKEKINGKQKAYCVIQDGFTVASDEDMAKLEAETLARQNELEGVNAQIKIKEEKIKSFTSSLTTEEAKQRLIEVKSEVGSLEAKLEALSNQHNMVDQDAMNKARDLQTKAVQVKIVQKKSDVCGSFL